MAFRQKYALKRYRGAKTTPFESAEEAWFWFMQANQARLDGARADSKIGLYNRPCEPLDILKTLDRLHRNRCLLKDHLLVLRYYGRRLMAPDRRRVNEVQAYKLWREAMEHLEGALVASGVVRREAPRTQSPASWLSDAANAFTPTHFANPFEGVAAQ